jgi:hypothetical protein
MKDIEEIKLMLVDNYSVLNYNIYSELQYNYLFLELIKKNTRDFITMTIKIDELSLEDIKARIKDILKLS